MPDEDHQPTADAPKPTNAEVIDGWFQREFSDSVVSRDTTLWNFVFAAKEKLKSQLP